MDFKGFLSLLEGLDLSYEYQSIDEIRERFEKRREFYDNCDYKIRVVSGRTPKSYAMEILKIMDDISNKKI